MLKFRGTGDTLEEAVANAMRELKVELKDGEYTVSVVQEPRKGFLGIGKRVAEVEVTLTPRFLERKIEEVLKSIFESAGWHLDFTVRANHHVAKIEVDPSESFEKLETGFFRDLEYILTIHANRFTDSRYDVRFQLPESDQKREKEIREMVRKTARKILKSRRRFVFNPMPAFERRIVHETVKEFKGLRSYSIGREPDRRVVVEPVKNKKPRGRKKNRVSED